MTFIRFIEVVVFGGGLIFLALEIVFRGLKQIKSRQSPPQLLTAYPQEYYASMSSPECWKQIPLGVRVFYPLDSSKQVITSNKHGFRTHEFPSGTEDVFMNKKHCLILGGSTAWGLGASCNEKVGANILESILNEMRGQDFPWTVFNLSMMAATTQKELMYLLFWGVRLRPKYVISITGFNDLHMPSTHYDELNKVFYDREVATALKYHQNHFLHSGEFFYGCRQFLESQSELFRYWTKKRSSGENPRENASPLVTMGARVQSCVQNIVLLHHVSESIGAKYLAVLQPVSYGKKTLAPEERQQFDYFTTRHASHRTFKEFSALQQTEGSIYARIKESLQQQPAQVGLLDAGGLFDDESGSRFADGITHLNDQGHEELSRAIYGVLGKKEFLNNPVKNTVIAGHR